MKAEIVSSTKPLRQKSPIVASYPWQTSVLDIADLAGIFKDTCFKDFSERLLNLEGMISSASSVDWFALRQFLGFEPEYAHLDNLLLPPRANPGDLTALNSQALSVKCRSVLVSLLLRYRTVDIAASLESHPELPLRPGYDKSGDFGRSILLSDWLQNWPSLLSAFKLSLSHETVDHSSSVPSVATTAHNTNTSSQNRHIKVLRKLITFREVIAGLINVQLAVICLRRMLTETQIDQTGSNRSGFTHEDLEFLERICSNSERLELPLRLAFFISPLFLLIPKCVHKLKGRINVSEVMETGKSLGNKRPPLLLRVEKEIFSSLFRLATDEVCLLTEMKDCIRRMPWDEINAINNDINNDSVSSWFTGGNIPAPSSSPDNNSDPSSTTALPESQLHGAQQPNQSLAGEHDFNPSSSSPTAPSQLHGACASQPDQALVGEGDRMDVDEGNSRHMDIDHETLVGSHQQPKPDFRLSRLRDPKGGPSGKTFRKRRRQRDSSLSGEEKRMGFDDESEVPLRRRKLVQSDPPSIELRRSGSFNSRRGRIDFDNLFVERSVTLDDKDTPEKFEGKVIQGYDPTGALFEFTPALHVKEDLFFINEFAMAINAGFVDGRPLHVSDPEKSAFFVMTEAEFESKSAEEIQAIFRQRHILVTDMRSAPLQFDACGLSTLTGLATITYIQDQSIGRNPVTNEYKDSRLRLGRVRSLIRSSKENGKILNALHFPMPVEGMGMLPFSTDSASWRSIKGSPGCSQWLAPPLVDFRWGLAATAGALSWWHVVPNGLGTYVDTKTGLKWWIVARRKGQGHRLESFSEVDTFCIGGYEVDEPNVARWDLEAVILPPGTRLIMRPNTPYAVFTPEDAICHGGNFYATSTMQDTMFGIVHTFISPELLTNTDTKTSHGIFLRRIAAFYHGVLVEKLLKDGEYIPGHIPKLEDFDSVLDMITFCNLMIMANVLDFRTYTTVHGASDKSTFDLLEKHDVNSIPTMERYEMAHARGRCWDILHWFFSAYEIFDKEVDEPIDGFKQVAMRYLAHQGSAILEYKKMALKNELDEGLYYSFEDLEKQMKLCFTGYKDIPGITPPANKEQLSLAFPDSQRYGVRKLVEARPYECSTPKNLVELGTTAADAKFFKHYTNKFK